MKTLNERIVKRRSDLSDYEEAYELELERCKTEEERQKTSSTNYTRATSSPGSFQKEKEKAFPN